MTESRFKKYAKSSGPNVRRRGKTSPGRVRQSTKALAQFWLTPTTAEPPVSPPFCPLDPTDADFAFRDPITNFTQWRPHRT